MRKPWRWLDELELEFDLEQNLELEQGVFRRQAGTKPTF
jgi:hypothetical protein